MRRGMRAPQARAASARDAPPAHRERAQWRARVRSRVRTRANKPAVREAKAGAWHHCLKPNERVLFSCAATF